MTNNYKWLLEKYKKQTFIPIRLLYESRVSNSMVNKYLLSFSKNEVSFHENLIWLYNANKVFVNWNWSGL